MALDYAKLRSDILNHVRTTPKGSWDAPTFKSICPGADDNTLVLMQQIVHELYFAGIIIPGNVIRPNTVYAGGVLTWPAYQVTPHGKNVLSNSEYLPYDPDDYLKRLSAEIKDIDSTIVIYLEEALICFRYHRKLAAAVMLGCAAEKAILLLTQVFGDSIIDPKEKAKYEKEMGDWRIKRKYDAMWTRLEPIVPSLPTNSSLNHGLWP